MKLVVTVFYWHSRFIKYCFYTLKSTNTIYTYILIICKHYRYSSIWNIYLSFLIFFIPEEGEEWSSTRRSVVIISLTRNIEPFILNWSSSDTAGPIHYTPAHTSSLGCGPQVSSLTWESNLYLASSCFPLWLKLPHWELIILYEFSFVYHQIISTVGPYKVVYSQLSEYNLRWSRWAGRQADMWGASRGCEQYCLS